MNLSKIILATAIGFAGGIMLVEFCPKFKNVLDDGKQILSNCINKK